MEWNPKVFRQKVEEIEKSLEPVGMVHKDQYGYGASLIIGMEHGTKLYTHPKSPKEWQGIQEEELINLWVNNSFNVTGPELVRIYEHIQKRLKELNT